MVDYMDNPPNKKKAALYARVSTTDQNLDNQLNDLREYASRREYIIFKEYNDLGISGAKNSRPALNSLLEDAHKRKFDVVIVHKLDRFGRSLKDLLTNIDKLNSCGIDFVSYSQSGIDTTSSSGRLMFQMIGAFAEFERSLIQDRVKTGMKTARLAGKLIGRPRVVYDKEQISKLRQNGASIRDISRQTGISKSKVSNILKCP